MADMVQSYPSLSEMKATPEMVVELSTTQKLGFERAELEDFQLAALKMRFETLVDAVPMIAVGIAMYVLFAVAG